MNKTNILFPLAFCVSFLPTACNDEVFIEDFLPQTPSITLSETDPEQIIDFQATNWEIQSIQSHFISTGFTYADTLGKWYPSLYSVQNSCDKFLCKSLWSAIQIGHDEHRNLTVRFVENLFDQADTIRIKVGNDFESRTIPVVYQPSTRYRLDSISFAFDKAWVAHTITEETDSITVINSKSQQPVNISIHPYKNIYKIYEIELQQIFNTYGEFYMSAQEYLNQILEKKKYAITVPIPQEDKLVPGTTKIPLIEGEQKGASNLPDDFQAVVTIGPGENQKLKVLILYHYFDVPFSVHVSSPVTGKKQTFSGELTVKEPYKYLIIKANIVSES